MSALKFFFSIFRKNLPGVISENPTEVPYRIPLEGHLRTPAAHP